ncbi:MAG: helix-turn-helix domain-containing protein [Planctomycetota bacterium]|nr:helix-turn-helix domain-containing protein [Planctomycetota bacterium]
MKNEEKRWWTVRQLAAHYGVSVRSVYVAIDAGRLLAHRFGAGYGAIRISEANRIAWEESSRQEAATRAATPFVRKDPEAKRLIDKHLNR